MSLRSMLMRPKPPQEPAIPVLSRPDVVWAADLEVLAEWSARSHRSWIFLHPPKTGGSTFVEALRAASGWDDVKMTSLWSSGEPCPCGSGCFKAPRRAPLSGQTAPAAGRDLVMLVGHVPYSSAVWLREALTERGGRIDAVVLTTRPIRDRLPSAFRDYWTQVRLAQEHAAGKVLLSAHQAVSVKDYASDARHYQRPDGSIDGRAWFRAFTQHGSGTSFFLRDIFPYAEEPRAEVAERKILLAPLSSQDDVLRRVTGFDPPARARVSRPANPTAVAAALEESQDLINELALRDAELEWLNHEPAGA